MLTRPQNSRPRQGHVRPWPQEYAHDQAKVKARAFKAKARTVDPKAY